MFVTFEGLDGSGTTTQAELLRQHLEEAGRDVVLTREPGGTELGESVRELVLGETEISPWAEAALFAAARAELVSEVIQPALERGADVVCDRYLDSSLAYQGIARGLGVERVLALNLDAIRGILPDVTFLLARRSRRRRQRAPARPGTGSSARATRSCARSTRRTASWRLDLRGHGSSRSTASRAIEEVAEEVRDKLPGLS